MTTNWQIETRGDPLGVLREFVAAIWLQANLESMLVSPDSLDATGQQPRLLENPNDLDAINPFKPLMTLNTARQVVRFVESRPDRRLGVMLRPCEMRALIEVGKRTPFDEDRLLTICVDCLGTFPADEFQWRAERKGSPGGLTGEALQFARQGGISAYRYRPACQMCAAPDAQAGQLNIGVLGLPVRQYLLVRIDDEVACQRLGLDHLSHAGAEADLLAQRERMLARLAERRNRTRERVTAGMAGVFPNDLEALIRQIESCEPCQECLDACPICAAAYPQRDEYGHFVRDSVIGWLISCAGCGMCEQACPRRLPLSAIFGSIQEQLLALETP